MNRGAGPRFDRGATSDIAQKLINAKQPEMLWTLFQSLVGYPDFDANNLALTVRRMSRLPKVDRRKEAGMRAFLSHVAVEARSDRFISQFNAASISTLVHSFREIGVACPEFITSVAVIVSEYEGHFIPEVRLSTSCHSNDVPLYYTLSCISRPAPI